MKDNKLEVSIILRKDQDFGYTLPLGWIKDIGGFVYHIPIDQSNPPIINTDKSVLMEAQLSKIKLPFDVTFDGIEKEKESELFKIIKPGNDGAFSDDSVLLKLQLKDKEEYKMLKTHDEGVIVIMELKDQNFHDLLMIICPGDGLVVGATDCMKTMRGRVFKNDDGVLTTVSLKEFIIKKINVKR